MDSAGTVGEGSWNAFAGKAERILPSTTLEALALARPIYPKHKATPTVRLYRLDTFAVPIHALPELLHRVRETHALLKTRQGLVQDLVLEQPEGDGTTRVATLVEWADEAAMRDAGEAVRAMRRGSGFDPQTFMTERGITADMRVYRAIKPDPAG